jgi:mannose-6-phosphate isomerase-like protein (cupin superfamily)
MAVTNAASAEHYVWGEVCEGWRLLARPDLSVIRERIPPGRGEVAHYHDRARQMFFVLSGGLEMQIEAARFTLTAGDAIEIPPGQRHRVRNVLAEDALFLVISAPTTTGDRVEVSLEEPGSNRAD